MMSLLILKKGAVQQNMFSMPSQPRVVRAWAADDHSKLEIDAERQMAQSLFSEDEFVEIFVDVPLEIAEARDPKGLYKKARCGELKLFTGIDSPYEQPLVPNIRLDTTVASPDDTADLVMRYLRSKGLVVLEQKYKAMFS